MGLEPTTATLATWRSTTELHPLDEEKYIPFFTNYKPASPDFKGENPPTGHSANGEKGQFAARGVSRKPVQKAIRGITKPNPMNSV